MRRYRRGPWSGSRGPCSSAREDRRAGGTPMVSEVPAVRIRGPSHLERSKVTCSASLPGSLPDDLLPVTGPLLVCTWVEGVGPASRQRVPAAKPGPDHDVPPEPPTRIVDIDYRMHAMLRGNDRAAIVFAEADHHLFLAAFPGYEAQKAEPPAAFRPKELLPTRSDEPASAAEVSGSTASRIRGTTPRRRDQTNSIHPFEQETVV
jgi:hypothetical protein